MICQRGREVHPFSVYTRRAPCDILRQLFMSLFASFRTRVIQMADFTESYLLSLMYLYQAACKIWDVADRIASRPAAALEQGWWLVGLIQSVDLLAVLVLVGLLLLLSKPPLEGPRELKDVLVPLAVSLFFLAYSLQPLFPPALRAPLAPLSVQVPCSLASLVFGAAGSLISVWGILSLGRSFGIFVAVRKVVLAGPYRYVRHPIYSGYLLMWVGMILASLSVAVVLLVIIHTMLIVYRARLEERRLAESSPEYRAYLQQTGFLFPRLRERPASVV